MCGVWLEFLRTSRGQTWVAHYEYTFNEERKEVRIPITFQYLPPVKKSGGPRVDSVTAAAIIPLPIEPTHLTVTMFASRGWYPQNRIFQLFGAGDSRNFIFSGELHSGVSQHE